MHKTLEYYSGPLFILGFGAGAYLIERNAPSEKGRLLGYAALLALAFVLSRKIR